MTVGLPGTGIGGFFYLISALVMPAHELIFLIRGRSSLARWKIVGRQTAIAMGIIAGIWGMGWLIGSCIRAAHSRSLAAMAHSIASPEMNVIRITALSVSLGVLATIIFAMNLLALMIKIKAARTK
jgi:hypothetical protein